MYGKNSMITIDSVSVRTAGRLFLRWP